VSFGQGDVPEVSGRRKRQTRKGGDGDGDGCSRAELRLDQIGRCDSSVDCQIARRRSYETVRPRDCQTAKPCERRAGDLPVLHHVRQARSVWQGRHRNGGAGMAGPEPSIAEPIRPNPAQPSPTQPNPTQPVKCKTGGSAKARIRSPGAFRQEDRSGWRQCRWHVGCRDCGPGARRELWGPGSGGGVDLSSPWRGLNCQLRTDGQCAGDEY
jgi:hypothetical protein